MNAEISQRERGMAERRARIVEAARDLIRATGDTGLSMRALAERAGVSLATPYNLFGSKQAVMLGVLEADLAAFRAGLDAAGPGDPLRRLFDNVALAARFYDEDPGFYRALFTALAGAGGPELRLLFGPPRHALWVEMIQAAQAAGQLRGEVDADLLARALEGVFGAALPGWIASEIDAATLEARIGFGFAAVLGGAADDAAARRRLAERMAEDQARLTGADV